MANGVSGTKGSGAGPANTSPAPQAPAAEATQQPATTFEQLNLKANPDVTDMKNLTKEEIQLFLDEAPVGTKITGFVDKWAFEHGQQTKPSSIEKVQYYQNNIYAPVPTKNLVTEWKNGSGTYVTANWILGVLKGTNKYTETYEAAKKKQKK